MGEMGVFLQNIHLQLSLSQILDGLTTTLMGRFAPEHGIPFILQTNAVSYLSITVGIAIEYTNTNPAGNSLVMSNYWMGAKDMVSSRAANPLAGS